VLSKLEYLAVCRSFQLLTLHARGDAAKAFEILVLLPRSPLVMLVRQAGDAAPLAPTPDRR
jgi:hypothetical protein